MAAAALEALEARVAELEHRLDQTAGRLHAALEVLEKTSAAIWDAAPSEFWAATFEELLGRAPPVTDAPYFDAYRAVLAHMLLERFRPKDGRRSGRSNESVGLRADALEAVFSELLLDLYRLHPGGPGLLRTKLRHIKEDALPSNRIANIEFNDWVVRTIIPIEDRLDSWTG